jgi:hypothetical protein
MSDTLTIGKKLVELCRQGKNKEAMETMPQRMEGLEAVKKKGEWWEANHEVHGAEIEGPFPHGDRFVVRFKYDVTAKSGPMAGKRFNMDEAALYTVKDGKITHEEFFYTTGA